MRQGYKNIDDLFRSEFKDFELDPPEHIWENVKSSIPSAGSSKPFYRSRYGGIIGLSSVLILAGLFSLYYLTKAADPIVKSAMVDGNTQTREPEISTSVNEKVIAVEFTNEVRESAVETFISMEKASGNIVSVGITESNNKGTNYSDTRSSLQTDKTSSENSLPTSESYSDSNSNPANEDNLLAMANGSTHLPVTSLPDSYDSDLQLISNSDNQDDEIIANEMNPSESVSPNLKSDYGSKGNILLGLTITPEITFFPSDNKFTNQSFSIDGSVIYKFSGYLLQSGLGVQFASDDGHYKVDYRKFLGTYEDVYDVTFDTTGGGMTPIYHTQTVEVYDSVPRISLSPTKNKYTYFQIPLLFGYGEDYRRLSWFVKGGPSLAIMIHEGQPAVSFDSGNDKVLNYENELPSRIKTNWSFVFSAGAGYKLGNHISITLEPTVRLYIKSAYERNVVTTKHPYSFGVRTGLLFGF